MKPAFLLVLAVVVVLCPVGGIGAGIVTACANQASRRALITFLCSGAAVATAFGVLNGLYVRYLTPNKKFAAGFGVVNALFAVFGINTYAALSVCQFGHRWNWTAVPFLALGTCFAVHSVMVPTGRLPSPLYRKVVSYGCYTYTTSAFLGFFLSPLIARIPRAEWSWIPGAVLLLLTVVALRSNVARPACLGEWDVVDVYLGSSGTQSTGAARGRLSKPKPRPVRLTTSKWSDLHVAPPMGSVPPLRIIQITDPHIGSLMPPDALREICAQAIEAEPDFVFLTGDFFTAEANAEPREALLRALEPLVAIRDRVFGCFGNHDLELESVAAAVREVFGTLGFRLLVDEVATVHSRLGDVDVVGMNYVSRHMREAHVRNYFSAYRPSSACIQTVVLLHDPAGFKFVPSGLRALVLSGHTHGGLIGFFACGLRHATLVRLVGGLDNGGFEMNSNLLYAHRGQGSRALLSNLVLRLGVPPEFSVLMLTPSGQ